ncbi:MAG: isomerizing glutamine--fructose-6-phosphate transaminase [Spirochaetota bacterium]
MRAFQQIIADSAKLEIIDFNIHERTRLDTYDRIVPYYVMSYMKEGSSTIRYRNREYVAHEGEVIIVPRHILHDHYMGSSRHTVFLWWHFNLTIGDHLDVLRFIKEPTIFTVEHRRDFEEQFLEYVNLQRREHHTLSSHLLRRAKAIEIMAYLLESVARIPATAELASELRYRNPIVERNTVYFGVSQSGETADTLYAMRELQRKGARVLGICNVVGSTIPRESDGGVYIHSGPEIAVASTKAFTSQLTAFYLYALMMARMRHMGIESGLAFIEDLEKVPALVQEVIDRREALVPLARKYAKAEDFLFLGRGINYPVALEGALKLKEISYIHAEGYSAAEIKHGPIALINEVTPSVFIVPDDGLRDKVISNMKEVKARSGQVIALAVDGDREVERIADDVFFVPHAHELVYPYLMVVPLQLFAYYTALELGRNVDQPRNLAKSVTVE